MALFVAVHLIFLHSSGSSNPIGLPLNRDKIVFFNYFIVKDLVTIVLMLFVLLFLRVYYPYSLMDHENFIAANPMVTPPHIQPEWYFLFAYAILRSIPNKVGGVVILLMSLLIILILPIINRRKVKGSRFNPAKLVLFWFHAGTFFILTWLGRMPVEPPFSALRKFYTVCYFAFYFLYPLI